MSAPDRTALDVKRVKDRAVSPQLAEQRRSAHRKLVTVVEREQGRSYARQVVDEMPPRWFAGLFGHVGVMKTAPIKQLCARLQKQLTQWPLRAFRRRNPDSDTVSDSLASHIEQVGLDPALVVGTVPDPEMTFSLRVHERTANSLRAAVARCSNAALIS